MHVAGGSQSGPAVRVLPPHRGNSQHSSLQDKMRFVQYMAESLHSMLAPHTVQFVCTLPCCIM